MAVFSWWKNRKKRSSTSVATDKTKGSTRSGSKSKVVEKRKVLHEHHKKFLEPYIICTKNHDIVQIRKHTKPGARVHFPKAEVDMTFEEYLDEVQNIWAAFPDFKMTLLEAPESISDDKVKMKVTVSGTHTGKPYGFGPYPAIEATGIKVKNDPEYIIFTIEDGVITTTLIESTGPMAGPPGVYTQLGGLVF